MDLKLNVSFYRCVWTHNLIFSFIYIFVVGRSKKPVKSMVIGRPILLALEDIDGSPSFLEKALCFIEQYGIFDCFIFFKFRQILKYYECFHAVNFF